MTGGAIGSLTGVPVYLSTAATPGQMMELPNGLWMHHLDYYRLWGKDQWETRLRDHPGRRWVAYGLAQEGTGNLLDLLLPGWRR